MKIQRRSAKPPGTGPRKSRFRIGQRAFVFFILTSVITAAIGLSLNLYFEEREASLGMANR
jgi:Na+/H+-dicarboxylate symporter